MWLQDIKALKELSDQSVFPWMNNIIIITVIEMQELSNQYA